MFGNYVTWPIVADIPLLLAVSDNDGSGKAGLSPQVGIRRYRSKTGAALDNFFWNGTIFVAGVQWQTMPAVDGTNNPGLYSYLFSQTLVGVEQSYLVYYRSTATIIGFDVEIHAVTKDAAKVDEVHKVHGLDQANPMTVSPTARVAGAVAQTIAKIGTSVTVTRT